MRVSDRYLVGLLAPQQRRIKPEEFNAASVKNDEVAVSMTGTVDERPEQLDELAVSGKGTAEDGTTETSTPPVEKMFPSSMGMTFGVSGEAKAIQVKAGWGQYERVQRKAIDDDSTPKKVWKRQPIQAVSQPIS